MSGPSSRTGSPTWQRLLADALACLDAAERILGARISWAFGGGTVLMIRYAHRTSRDVDLFLRDPQALAALSPRLNDTASALAADYVEASHYLKLTRPLGEIDFVVAPELSSLPPEALDVDGRTVPAEASLEIVAKKAFYRAASLKVRDVIDWAVVLAHEPRADDVLAPLLRTRKSVLLHRLETMAPGFEAHAREELELLPAGEALVGDALALVRAHLERLG